MEILLIFLGLLQFLALIRGYLHHRLGDWVAPRSVIGTVADGGMALLMILAVCLSLGAVFQWIVDVRIGILDAYQRAWRKLSGWTELVLMFALIVIGGSVLLGGPGIFAGILLFPSFFIFAEEEIGVMQALLKSIGYVSGAALKVGLLVWAIWLPLAVAGVILGGMMVVWLLPFVGFYMYAIYEKLKTEKGTYSRPIERRPEPWQCMAVVGLAAVAVFINQFELQSVKSILFVLLYGI